MLKVADSIITGEFDLISIIIDFLHDLIKDKSIPNLLYTQPFFSVNHAWTYTCWFVVVVSLVVS